MDVEKVIFNLYKDEVVISSVFKKKIMENFGVSLRQASDLYVKITNYQIKRYNKKLTDYYDILTHEEKEISSRRASQRKYRRKK